MRNIIFIATPDSKAYTIWLLLSSLEPPQTLGSPNTSDNTKLHRILNFGAPPP